MLLRAEEQQAITASLVVDHGRLTWYPAKPKVFDTLFVPPYRGVLVGPVLASDEPPVEQDPALAPTLPVDAKAVDERVSANSVARASTTGFGKLEPAEQVRAVPIQVWEGRVKSVDADARTMQVVLSAKIGNVPDHTGEINLEWVASQDIDLVRPGAIFYWTLYKETTRGTVRNSQELRFRRLPSWSRSQLTRIRKDAERLFLRVKSPRRMDHRKA